MEDFFVNRRNSDQIQPKATEWAARVLGREVTLIPLAGDGGARRYFRLPGEEMLLLYGPDKAENMAWLCIGRHLWYKNLAVPRILANDLEAGFFLLEDLGDHHLVDPHNNPALSSVDPALFYPAATELLARLHNEALEGFNTDWCFQTKSYNAAMIEKQEIDYFLEFMILNYLKWPKLPLGIKREVKSLARLAAPLPEAWVLMHRDFQGRNLLVKNNRVYAIDWQGARPGAATYDLTSLLEESPHHPLGLEFKEELIRHYLACRGKTHQQKSFRRELALVGAARLMQALGAYAKLTMAGKSKFKAYMAPTFESLQNYLRYPNLMDFPILRGLVDEAAAKLSEMD